jgi:hypothetical protein
MKETGRAGKESHPSEREEGGMRKRREPGTKVAFFEQKTIQKVCNNEEWFFVVEDVVAALTDTVNAKDYVKKMRKRDPILNEGGDKLSPPFPCRPRAEDRR